MPAYGIPSDTEILERGAVSAGGPLPGRRAEGAGAGIPWLGSSGGTQPGGPQTGLVAAVVGLPLLEERLHPFAVIVGVAGEPLGA